MAPIDAAIPVLPSRSMDATVAFYARFGFEGGAHGFDSGYAILRRGTVELHFVTHDSLVPEESSAGCYIRVDDVDSFHRSHSSARLPRTGIPRMDALADKPWGLREFAIVDSDRNLVRIGQILDPVEQRSDARSVSIAARPTQVSAAVSDPARIARWWGPDGFSNTIHEFDFRPGGTWLSTMRGPDGKDYPNENRFMRLVPDATLEVEPLTGHYFLLSIELRPSGQGTRVHWRQTFDKIEHYERIAPFAARAKQQNLQRLRAEVLGAAPDAWAGHL